MSIQPQYREDAAQTAEWYPPAEYLAGTVTNPTCSYALYSSSTSEIASGSATVDSTKQAVSSVSQRDRTITVTDTSGMAIGRRYWLCSSGGRGYYVDVVDLTSTIITLAQPARYAISSGFIVGVRCTFSLTTTHTSDGWRNARELWTLTVDGATHYHERTVDIVKSPWSLPLTEMEIEQIATSHGEVIGEYGADQWLREGASDHIALFIRARGSYPDLVRNREIFVPAAVFWILAMRTAGDPVRHEQFLAMHKDAAASAFSAVTWYDDDDDLSHDDSAGAEIGDAAGENRPPPQYLGVT